VVEEELGLADPVRAAGWPGLLPAHRADGEDQPAGQPRCVATQRLSDRLVLAVVEDDRGRTYPVPLVVEGEVVRRARAGDGAGQALVAALAEASCGDGFEVVSWHQDAVTGERAVAVDQTNESVVVGDRAIVKWSFRADEGPHPAPSLLAELERSGFTGMPRPWGALQWRPTAAAAPRLLALVADFVPGAVDGWTWAVEDVRDSAASGDDARAAAGGSAVGDLVATFHRALAGSSRPATPAETAAWRTGALADLDRALEVTDGSARAVLDRYADEVRALFCAIPAELVPVIRVHGDLHVGQVLRPRTDGGRAPSYLLTDFDGNPVVPPAQRSEPQPAALDVAGMAQSFLHVGLVVRKHHPTLDVEAVRSAAQVARQAFLDTYVSQLGDRGDLLDPRLLRPFAVRQVCREFTYAATHLPRWSYVPQAALPMLLGDHSR
jgi:maltokinase